MSFKTICGTGNHSEPSTEGKTSKTTSNAGARLACGVIGFAPEPSAL